MLIRRLLTNRVTTGESKAYPNLKPARFEAEPGRVFGRAVEVARGMDGWRNFEVDPESLHLSCEAVTGLFKFVDDVDIWVSADVDVSVVKMRSKSRVGNGDLGTNARRIKRYLAALRRAMR